MENIANSEITEKDITRYQGDTYPERFDIEIDNSKVDLTGWTLKLVYYESQDGYNNTKKIIEMTGVNSKFKNGEVKFYPRVEFTKDITSGSEEYQGFNVVGTHKYYVIREKLFYYVDIEGDLVTLDGESYIAYDGGNPEHTELTRYSSFNETMTHFNGLIYVKNRLID